MLVRAGPAVRMIAIPAFSTETEEYTLLGGLRAFAKNARVRAGEASFAFLQNWWSAWGTRKRKPGVPRLGR